MRHPSTKRMSRTTAAILALSFTLAATTARGGILEDLALADLPLFDPEQITVEVNLEGALLALVAAATREEDPEFAELVGSLESIHVRITDLEQHGPGEARQSLRTASARLEAKGWQSMVRIREEGDEMYVYLRTAGERLTGLVVLFSEGGAEAGLVSITGDLDPASVGRLAAGLDLPGLDAASAALEEVTP